MGDPVRPDLDPVGWPVYPIPNRVGLLRASPPGTNAWTRPGPTPNGGGELLVHIPCVGGSFALLEDVRREEGTEESRRRDGPWGGGGRDPSQKPHRGLVQATMATEKAPKARLMQKVNERTAPLKLPHANQVAWTGVCVVSVAAMRGVLLYTARKLGDTKKVEWTREGESSGRDIDEEKDPLGIAKDMLGWEPTESPTSVDAAETSNAKERRDAEGETTQRADEWWVSLPIIYVATMDDPRDGMRGPYSINMTPFAQPTFHAVCFEDAQDARNFMYLASTMQEFIEKRPGIRPERPREFKAASIEQNFEVVVFRKGVLDLRPGMGEEELYVQMVEKGGIEEWGGLVQNSILRAK